jgi:hypothetical protein
VEAKGKGKMQTYWANPKKSASGSVVSSTNTNESDDSTAENADHIRRLVDWNADILGQHLRLVIAKRDASSSPSNKMAFRHGRMPELPAARLVCKKSDHGQERSGNILDEVRKSLSFRFDAVAARKLEVAAIELECLAQLHVRRLYCSHVQAEPSTTLSTRRT